jgi:glycerol uptake facilitator-like aquaporin
MGLAWTGAVLLPIVRFVRVSGAHVNPAVTIALAASGRIAWRETPLYLTGQTAGAFLGSAVVLVSLGKWAHLGAHVPAAGATGKAFVGELGFTALLVASVFLLSDRGEGPGRWRLVPPAATVGLATFVLGQWTGTCSLNPARALVPAVLSGTFVDLWVELVAVPPGALLVALVW